MNGGGIVCINSSNNNNDNKNNEVKGMKKTWYTLNERVIVEGSRRRDGIVEMKMEIEEKVKKMRRGRMKKENIWDDDGEKIKLYYIFLHQLHSFNVNFLFRTSGLPPE